MRQLILLVNALTALYEIAIFWNALILQFCNYKNIPVSSVKLNCVCVTLDVKRTLGQQPLKPYWLHIIFRKATNALLFCEAFCGTLVI